MIKILPRLILVLILILLVWNLWAINIDIQVNNGATVTGEDTTHVDNIILDNAMPILVVTATPGALDNAMPILVVTATPGARHE